MAAPPPGPVSRFGHRFGARILDLVLVVVAWLLVLVVVGETERPFAAVLLLGIVAFVYEATLVALLGTTPGKQVAGLRVVSIDSVQPPTTGQAVRRAAADAGLLVIPVLGQVVAMIGLLADPVRRTGADQLAGTMVVPKAAVLPVRARDLPGYADGARPPRLTTFGRVPDAGVRMRARLLRVASNPLLSGVIGALAVLLAVIHPSLLTVIVVLGAWIVLFVVDETRRVARTASSPGHDRAGLVIVDTRTGRAPSTGRSLARAVVLALTLYVPVLWPLLGVSALMMATSRTGRSLHDLAGRTVVVPDSRIAPEEQRLRAMALRVGQGR